MNGQQPQDGDTPPAIPASSEHASTHLPPPLDVPPPLPETHTPPPLPGTQTPARTPDPWAHRRGEPRLFALAWTIYVLVAVVGSIMWVARFASVSTGSYGPAARIMLVVVALGATVLWPMVRLSQASPRGRVISHVLADVFIVLMPIQFVLWPLMVLANWPVAIVAGIAAMIAAWVVLAGGLLALALSGRPLRDLGDPRLLSRAVWMCVVLALVAGGPACSLVFAMMKRSTPTWMPMVSPITGIPAVTGVGLSGPQSPISLGQWESIGVVAGAGLALWVIAGVRGSLGRRPRAA